MDSVYVSVPGRGAATEGLQDAECAYTPDVLAIAGAIMTTVRRRAAYPAALCGRGSSPRPLFGGRKELRKLARTFPSVYELLPRFPNAVIQAGTSLNIFDEANWQLNTVTPDARHSGFDVEQAHLTAAEKTLKSLPLPQDPPYLIPLNDQLVIFGNKPRSVMIQVEVGPAPELWWNFDHAQKGRGDDVVPVQSAQLAGVSSVEIQEQDVSYFHPIERGMASADMHAFLPVLDEVGTIVAEFFRGRRTAAELLPRGLPASRFHPDGAPVVMP
jgi:hypothetical protein